MGERGDQPTAGGAMTPELSIALAVRMAPWPKRWLVCQIRSGPLAAEIVYAQTFCRRSSALKAAKAAQERTKILGYRMPPQIVRLPVDAR
jgi:hypothetical protein